jgi:hypothetical protein
MIPHPKICFFCHFFVIEMLELHSFVGGYVVCVFLLNLMKWHAVFLPIQGEENIECCSFPSRAAGVSSMNKLKPSVSL